MRACFLATVLSLCMVAPGQFNPIDQSNTVLAGDYAYFIAPPRMLTDDIVDTFAVAPGGRYALIWGQTLPHNKISPLIDAVATGQPGETAKPVFKIWDADDDVVKTIPVEPGKPRPSFGKLAWSIRPGVAFQCVAVTRDAEVLKDPAAPRDTTQLFRLSLADGSFKVVASDATPTDGEGHAYCSPTKPIVVVIGLVVKRKIGSDRVYSTAQIRVYDLDGTETARKNVDLPGFLNLGNNWLADGTHLVGELNTPGQSAAGSLKSTVVINTSTGTVTPTNETLILYTAPEKKLPLTVVARKVIVTKDNTDAPIWPLWLEATESSDQTRALVTMEGWGATLMPDLRNLVYLSRNRLFACEIAKMDKSVFLAMVRDEELKKALGRTKEIGVGLSIYGKDHDDAYPDKGNFESEISPYLRNNGVLDGFVYTFKGGDIKNVKDPNTVELGFVPVKGGRCVLYADNHSKFVKD